MTPALPDVGQVRSLPALIEREHRRRRSRRIGLVVGLVVTAAIVAAIVIATRPRPVPLSERFRTAPVIVGPVVREVRATGRVGAVSTISVGAEISGRVSTVEATWNQRVKAGDVLARFDVSALEAQRAQSSAMALSARAQLAQTRADLAQATRNKARADELFAQKAQSESEHEASATARTVAQSRYSAAEANLAAQNALATVASSNLGHAVIRSPIDGVVIARNIDPGQTVTAMLTTPVLFTVAADLRRMEVIAAVDEADIAEIAVAKQAAFSVTGFTGRTFTGTVSEVRNSAQIVQDVVTYSVVLSVDNVDLALRPGMTASVRIRTGQIESTRKVPSASLRFTPPGSVQPEGDAVWTVEGDAVTPRAVQAGLTNGEETAIDGELAVGTLVLVDLSPEGRKAYGIGK
jgi:HlyD family secretion protein